MEGKRVVALGFFDGVHRGHGALLSQCRRRADQLGVRAAVLSFDRHPGTLITGSPVRLLNTPADREELLRRLYGIDEVLLCHFDQQMMQLPWEAFIDEYLCRRLQAAEVVCGHDYHFGWHGEGDPVRLVEACRHRGICCHVIGKVVLDGVTVSSTHIRGLVAAGEIGKANEFLGHRHGLTGTVVHGRQLGRTLGAPTANLLLPEDVLPPAFGVYATEVFVGQASHMAVTNVGVRPTVDGGDQITVEPWLLDFGGDLYGKTIRVEFCAFLRPERRFASLEQLQAAILENAAQTRAYFA